MRRSALVAAVVLLASCGGSAKVASNASAPTSTGSSSSVTTTATPDGTGVLTPVITGPDAAVVGSPLPVVPTVDLHTGKIVRLDWLLPGDKPVLVWFWAPH
jgi:hypothetical protein